MKSFFWGVATLAVFAFTASSLYWKIYKVNNNIPGGEIISHTLLDSPSKNEVHRFEVDNLAATLDSSEPVYIKFSTRYVFRGDDDNYFGVDVAKKITSDAVVNAMKRVTLREAVTQTAKVNHMIGGIIEKTLASRNNGIDPRTYSFKYTFSDDVMSVLDQYRGLKASFRGESSKIDDFLEQLKPYIDGDSCASDNEFVYLKGALYKSVNEKRVIEKNLKQIRNKYSWLPSDK